MPIHYGPKQIGTRQRISQLQFRFNPPSIGAQSRADNIRKEILPYIPLSARTATPPTHPGGVCTRREA